MVVSYGGLVRRAPIRNCTKTQVRKATKAKLHVPEKGEYTTQAAGEHWQGRGASTCGLTYFACSFLFLLLIEAETKYACCPVSLSR